ncbi:hypothetical protein Tco_0916572 [Tanacetum coccineum]
MKLLQYMQLIQKLRDDQKCMNKVYEDMSGSYEQKSCQGRDLLVEKTSKSSSALYYPRNTGLHPYHFTLFLLVGNIVTNSRVHHLRGRLLALLFYEVDVLHVNWTSYRSTAIRRD